MELTAQQITELLADQDLLISAPNFDGEVKHLAYNSNDVEPETLLFIKGRFKAEYLTDAIQKGVKAWSPQKLLSMTQHYQLGWWMTWQRP